MFMEHAVLSGFSGESAFDLEFILIVAAVFFVGLFLFFVGYYIKDIWGAVIALIPGTLLFLCERGLLSALIQFCQ